jgi:hypothetical protein
VQYCLISVTAAALFTMINVESVLAQVHQIPARNSCIREFYDPGMYNYLTFKNNCSQSLTIVFVAKDGSGAGGSMDLRPGGQDSVGKLAGRVPKVGEYQLYVCQSGYVPVDGNGKVVTKPRMDFRCRPKSE